MKNVIQTTHDLDFEAYEWHRNNAFMMFRIGTCNGLWYATKNCYCIISISNDKPGNGHLEDVFEWFENSAKRDNRGLMILEFFNARFKKHCIDKRGFIEIPNTENLIKLF